MNNAVIYILFLIHYALLNVTGFAVVRIVIAICSRSMRLISLILVSKWPSRSIQSIGVD